MFPEEKPRYVMGVGYPEDLLVSIALGADMFDCVWPTRTAVSFNGLSICSDSIVISGSQDDGVALRQRNHTNGHCQSPQLYLHVRLWPCRRRLPMQMLSA